jgi:thiosulfate dehydrogenase [quinone] large subunit
MNATYAISDNQITAVDRGWRLAAIGLLAVRFVQGWIYWGGGTRRFIYGPQKLDPAGHWMAYKFQTAMPGALLGTDHLIAFLLHHFYLLYAGVIIFSAVELISGFMLITGLFTRLAALATIGLSTVLMLMFGWQGATCIDEWTMAASNFAMGVTLLLAGGGAYSIDNWQLKRNPALAEKGWFRWAAGSLPLPLSDGAYKKLALVLFWIAVAFIVSTYSYYRGSVVTPFHGGPVSPAKHHVALQDGILHADGSVQFHAYVNAGTAADPSHVMQILLKSGDQVIETWDTKALAHLPDTNIHNDFAYQQIKTDPFGLVGGVGAAGTIHLPPSTTLSAPVSAGSYTLELISVNGHQWKLPVVRQ